MVSAVYFLLFFSKISFDSQAINYISRSAFAVYLFHVNSKIWDGFLGSCYSLFSNSKGIKAYTLVFLFLVAIYIMALVIDQIRLLCWKPIEQRLIPFSEKNDS